MAKGDKKNNGLNESDFSLADLNEIELLYSRGDAFLEDGGPRAQLLMEERAKADQPNAHTAPPAVSAGEAFDLKYSGGDGADADNSRDNHIQRRTKNKPTLRRWNRKLAADLIKGKENTGGFLQGIFSQNAVLFGGLGLFPLLVAAQDMRAGIVLAVFTAVVLGASAILSPFIQYFLPYMFRPAFYVAFSSGLIFGMRLFVRPIFPSAIESVEVYLPMIAVGSFVLNRVTGSQQTSALIPAFLMATSQAIGYGIVIIAVASAREILVSGTLLGRELSLPMQVEASALPFAGFLMLAFMGALVQSFSVKKDA